MTRIRPEKVASLLQGIISQYCLEHRERFDDVAMTLVDGVFVAPDMTFADVYISFSPYQAKRADKWFAGAVENTRDMQNYVFRKMTVRRVPQIRLHLSDPDKSFQLAQLFDSLRNDDRGTDSDNA